MDFASSEALSDNPWPGTPDSARSANDRRGCIATLSSSLTAVKDARAYKRAKHDCLSERLAKGISDLTLCVLTAARTPAPTTEIRLASLTVTPLQAHSGHLPATLPKEQQACAQLGLNSSEGMFTSCEFFVSGASS
jgi:hypothetical protein